MEQPQPLVPLLVRVGAAASIASLAYGARPSSVCCARGTYSRPAHPPRPLVRRYFLPGVAIRVFAPAYSALDLAVEGAFLAGITGGYICGWFAGMMIAIPRS